MEDNNEAETPPTHLQSGSQPVTVITADRECNACICGWAECAEIRNLLPQYASDDDPWKGRLY